MKKFFTLLLLLFSCLFVSAQITIESHRTDFSHRIYSYGLNDPEVWLSDDSLYCLKFSNAAIDDLGQDVHAVSVFYLSDNKEKALKAIQDFSNAVKSLGKDDKVTIKDFKGSPFEISYASKVTYGKPNFVLFKFFDPNIELVNKYGTKFRGAMFTGSTIVLDKAVKKQDKWK